MIRIGVNNSKIYFVLLCQGNPGFRGAGGVMRTRKSSRKKKIKYTKIQELWSSFDVGSS